MADEYQDLIDAAGQLPGAGGAPAPAAAQKTDEFQDVIDAAAALNRPQAQTQPAATAEQPDRGAVDAAARGVGNGVLFGAGPMFNAGLETLISKIPGLRDVAARTGFADPSVVNPDFTYDQRRAAYAKALDASREQHPIVSATGEAVGGLATTPLLPEVQVIKAPGFLARAANAAIPNAVAGAAQAANESLAHGESGTDALKAAGGGAIAGGVTGGILGGTIGRFADKAPEKADSWLIKDIVGHDRGTQPASATVKKQLANDAEDIRALANANPELKRAIDKAAAGDAEALQNLQQHVSDQLKTELEPRAGRYQIVDQAAEHGGVRVGDLDKHLEDAIGKQDVGDAPVEKSLQFWKDRIRDKWGTKDVVKIDPNAEIAPGFSVQKALDNYRARLAEAPAEQKPGIEATIKQIEDQFGTKERVYDPNAVVPTTRLRSLVTDLQTDLANAMGGLDEKTRYQKLKQVQKPVWDFLNEHLDTVAKRSPDAEQAVDEIRKSNDRLSALLNIQKVVDARVNRATSNAMAGMRPAFGIRGAIHQAVGPGVPGVAAAAFLGHPAVAAGLAMTTVAPGVKRAAEKAMASLIRARATGNVTAALVEDAIRHGVPRAVAMRFAKSSHEGAIRNAVDNLSGGQ